MFYILLPDREMRDKLMVYLQKNSIQSVFHFIPLHSSPMGQRFGYKEGDLLITEQISGRLLRLPFYYEITEMEVESVVYTLQRFLQSTMATVTEPLTLRMSVK